MERWPNFTQRGHECDGHKALKQTLAMTLLPDGSVHTAIRVVIGWPGLNLVFVFVFSIWSRQILEGFALGDLHALPKNAWYLK
jgi:hypothetical protein